MNITTARKVYRLIVPLIILCCALTLLGCNRNSTSTGKYFGEKKPQEFTELKKDGTFLIHQKNLDANGKYSIDGKRLILKLSSGEIVEGNIEGNTIIDNEGGRLTKQ
jgi:hypothetical protein